MKARTENAGGEPGTIARARTLAKRVDQLFAWLDDAPDWLKPERIQEEGVVHRPRSLGGAGGVVGRLSAIFDWIEAAADILEEMFGTGDRPQARPIAEPGAEPEGAG